MSQLWGAAATKSSKRTEILTKVLDKVSEEGRKMVLGKGGHAAESDSDFTGDRELLVAELTRHCAHISDIEDETQWQAEEEENTDNWVANKTKQSMGRCRLRSTWYRVQEGS